MKVLLIGKGANTRDHLPVAHGDCKQFFRTNMLESIAKVVAVGQIN